MTFFGMVMRRVDPFAVYAAERELSQHGIHISREALVSHYLISGQLRTLIFKMTASQPPQRMEEAAAAAMMEGPDESSNPRFVAPLKTGLSLSALVVFLVAVDGLLRFWKRGATLADMHLQWLLVIAGVLVCTCMVYAFLCARIGRVKANKLMTLIIALALVGGIYWLTRDLH